MVVDWKPLDCGCNILTSNDSKYDLLHKSYVIIFSSICTSEKCIKKQCFKTNYFLEHMAFQYILNEL